jgi:hypothetical protein
MVRDQGCRQHAPDPGQATAFPVDIHEDLVRQALSDKLSPDALQIVIDSCSEMDDPINLIDPLNHFDNGEIEASVARMRERYDAIRRAKTPEEALQLLGQILHASQDFVSHSNYVEMMVDICRASQAPIQAPPSLELVSLVGEPQADVKDGQIQVPESYEALARRAVASGELTTGHVSLMDYPFELFAKIPLLGKLTHYAHDAIGIPGTGLAVIPGMSYVVPVYKSHMNMSKDDADHPQAEVEVEEGITLYDLCLQTAARQTRFEFESHFLKAIAENPELNRIDWRKWKKPGPIEAVR